MMHAISISVPKGAQPVALTTASTVQAGGYYNRFSLARSSHESHDPRVGDRLWETTQPLPGTFAQSMRSPMPNAHQEPHDEAIATAAGL
jgi:hypothetical protein